MSSGWLLRFLGDLWSYVGDAVDALLAFLALVAIAYWVALLVEAGELRKAIIVWIGAVLIGLVISVIWSDE